MYYKQLVKVPNLANIEPINLHIQYGKNDEQGVFRGIQYYTALGNFALAYDVIPERYRTDFSPLLMSINRNIPPHTDSGILASLNFYLVTSNCRTVFYEPKKDAEIVQHQIPNQTNGRIFELDNLVQVDQFVANSGECYLLDVTKAHAVYNMSNEVVERKAFVLQTRIHSFSTVCDMLAKTGYIN